MGAEIAITVIAGSRVVLDRCGIRRIKRGPASCHNRSKHPGSRTAISNLCFASALITYGNGHPVDPCTHTYTRSLHPRVACLRARALVRRCDLPFWSATIRQRTTSTGIFSSNNGGRVSLSFHEFSRLLTFPTCLLRFLRFLQGSINSERHSLHRTGRN